MDEKRCECGIVLPASTKECPGCNGASFTAIKETPQKKPKTKKK